jgi:hypothetical protein
MGGAIGGARGWKVLLITTGWGLLGTTWIGAASERSLPLVFTQLATRGETAGGRIVRLAEGGSVEVLSRGFFAARDPHVSFDGKRILFSAKRAAADYWQIYELDLESRATRQLVRAEMDCRNPIYQSSLYVLSSDLPWHQVAFTGSLRGSPPSLYTVRLDGSDLRRISYNPYGDLDPAMMEDGRVLYAARQQDRIEPGPPDRLALFGLNLDGTDVALYGALQGSPYKRMPVPTAGGLVVFIESESLGPDGAGNLGAVSQRRPLASYQRLTEPSDALYVYPSPLPGGEILVSRRPASGKGTYGIVRFDPATRRSLPVFDDPAWHDIQAHRIAPRAVPDGRSSVVDPKEPTGQLYCLNAYISDLPQEFWLAPGTPLRFRLVEGAAGAAGAGSPILAKRVLGEFRAEPDGSFKLRVPANIPIELQLVDSNGMMLRSCRWIWVRNKEARGCIGCHEDPELTPENRYAAALARPAVNLILPPERRRTISFRRDVAPVLQSKCAGAVCHGGAVPPRLAGKSDLAGYLAPAARISPLVWRLNGKKSSFPWSQLDGDGALQPMPPPGSAPLTEDERLTIIEWIDLGAQP